MNRSTWVATAILFGTLTAGLMGMGGESLPTAPEPRPKPDGPPPDKDITAEAKEWNSKKYAAPPDKFRQGHTTPRQLDAKSITKTSTGFTVQLPSKAPIPTPTVHAGKVYVSGGFHSKEFYCFDAKTGELVWGITLDDDGPSAAVVEGDIAIFNTESCTMFAVDAKTGKHLWSHWLGDPLTSTPTIAGGVVFTSYPARGGGGGGQQGLNINNGAQAPNPPANANPAANANHPPCSHVIAALDLKTGKILWQRWIDSDVMTAPVAVDKELFATSFSGVVYKFNQADGAILSAVRARATSAPVIVGKDVYFTRRFDDGKAATEGVNTVSRADNNAVQAASKPRAAVYLDATVQRAGAQAGEAAKLDAGNGFAGGAPAAANPDAAWRNIGQGNVCTMQAFQGSRVLNLAGRNYNCMGDQVVCTDPASGREVWTYKLDGDLKKEGGFLGAPPAAAGGHLILATLKGDVIRLDPQSGKVVKTWATGSPTRFQPAVEGGRVYVGTQDGKLICIDTGDATLTGWPCWGGNPAHTGAVTK